MSERDLAPQTDGEWRKGWPIVLAAFFGMTIGSITFFTQGVFMKPLASEFGWSRTEFTVAALVTTTVSAIALPFVGQLILRVGPRPLVMIGWVLTMTAFAGLGLLQGSLILFWFLWGVIAFGITLAGPVTLSDGVASRFERHRGAAVSTAINGINVIASIAPLLASSLIGALGWRLAYINLAGAAFAICVPMLYFLFRVGRPGTGRKGGELSEATGMSLRQACGTAQFWVLGFSLFLVGAGLVATLVHFVPLLTDGGVAPDAAAAAASAYGLFAILSGASTGFLLDRFPLGRVAAILFMTPAAGSLMLVTGLGGLPGAVAGMATVGIAAGASIPVMALCVARQFGMKEYGPIFSVQMALFSLSQGFGALLVSIIRDHSGDYQLAFAMVTTCFLAGALMMLVLRKSRPPSER